MSLVPEQPAEEHDTPPVGVDGAETAPPLAEGVEKALPPPPVYPTTPMPPYPSGAFAYAPYASYPPPPPYPVYAQPEAGLQPPSVPYPLLGAYSPYPYAMYAPYPYAPYAMYAPYGAVAPTTSGLAIASFICSLLTLFAFPWAGIAGVICGHIALSQIRASGGLVGGRGFAIAGVIIGYSLLALIIVVYVAYLLFLALVLSSAAPAGLLG